MKQLLLSLLFFVVVAQVAAGQATPSPSPSPQRRANPAPIQQREGLPFELADYGVSFQADTRLIVVMAALEAAGFDAQPGRPPSEFRSKVRRDLTTLDPDLRERLKTFYERTRLPAPATPADQASRYVSLALALSPVPELTAPERSDDLPAGLLDVLDFAPLVREFYRRSGIEEHLVTYVRAYQSEGDRLRQPTSEMVRGLLTYLHTRPMTTSLERVEVKTTAAKKNKQTKSYSTRQKERRFVILPDLLAPRGTINFRVILDDYYAIVPEGTDPASSELRRAYLQYVIDALVLRFNRDIAARRDQIRQLLDDREKAGSQVSADVFLTVGRSLVAAADARYDEVRKLEMLGRSVRARLNAARDDSTRTSIGKEIQAEVAAIQDDTIGRLAEEYEKGAVLTFFFSDQLKGIETAGFDIANFFPDMIASFDPAREVKRPAEYAEARQRALAAKEARIAARRAESEIAATKEANNPRDTALVKELSAVEDTLRNKNYNDAETRLKEMLRNYPGEPRIFFALGQTASLAAMDATDDQIQTERLNRALGQYRLAIQAASSDSDKAILSRSHESMGRINAFLDNKEEALKEFEEAIKIGEVSGGAYQQALAGKRKLSQP
jgi:tetratricopeptide (TPR) repeat protein